MARKNRNASVATVEMEDTTPVSSISAPETSTEVSPDVTPETDEDFLSGTDMEFTLSDISDGRGRTADPAIIAMARDAIEHFDSNPEVSKEDRFLNAPSTDVSELSSKQTQNRKQNILNQIRGVRSDLSLSTKTVKHEDGTTILFFTAKVHEDRPRNPHTPDYTVLAKTAISVYTDQIEAGTPIERVRPVRVTISEHIKEASFRGGINQQIAKLSNDTLSLRVGKSSKLPTNQRLIWADKKVSRS